MVQRVIAGALWSFFGWYLVAHIASLTGMPVSVAPIGAVIMAVVALVDWPSLARSVATPRTSEPVGEPR